VVCFTDSMSTDTPDIATRQHEFDDWIERVHGEYRHGRGDRLGSLNYIDAAARARGRDAISDGQPVSLARIMSAGPNARGDGGPAYEYNSIETVDADRPGFLMRTDRLGLDCHGHVNTHIDALNHLGFHDQWYNGDPVADASGSGAVLDMVKHGIFTRGVYVNVAAARGAAYISPDRPVDGDDIDRALAASGTTFEPGDALLLDCGRDVFEADGGDWDDLVHKPGPGVGVAEWIAERKVSLLVWDMMDAISPDQVSGALHYLHWAIGLILVDNSSFEFARPVLAQRGQAVGGLSISPLAISGAATGTNVNPMFIL
jgi:kynurenine formamidase